MPEASSSAPRRPFFTVALTPQEIEEDLAHIISSMKRDGRKKKRQEVPSGIKASVEGNSGASKER